MGPVYLSTSPVLHRKCCSCVSSWKTTTYHDKCSCTSSCCCFSWIASAYLACSADQIPWGNTKPHGIPWNQGSNRSHIWVCRKIDTFCNMLHRLCLQVSTGLCPAWSCCSVVAACTACCDNFQIWGMFVGIYLTWFAFVFLSISSFLFHSFFFKILNCLTISLSRTLASQHWNIQCHSVLKWPAAEYAESHPSQDYRPGYPGATVDRIERGFPREL